MHKIRRNSQKRTLGINKLSTSDFFDRHFKDFSQILFISEYLYRISYLQKRLGVSYKTPKHFRQNAGTFFKNASAFYEELIVIHSLYLYAKISFVLVKSEKNN